MNSFSSLSSFENSLSRMSKITRIVIDGTSDAVGVTYLDPAAIEKLNRELTQGRVVLAPLREHGHVAHFCRVCQTTHEFSTMSLCQYCCAPVCLADTVVSKRSLVVAPTMASVPYKLGATTGCTNMAVASCLECVAKRCWAQNIHYHHPRLTVQAPSNYAKRWRNIAPMTAAPLPSEARITFGALLSAYELAQQTNSELQDRITVLEHTRTPSPPPPTLFGSLDALIATYNETLERRGKATQYTALDRCNGYDMFPSPGSSPATTVASR